MLYDKYRLHQAKRTSWAKKVTVSCLFLLATVFLFSLFTADVSAASSDVTGLSYAAQSGLSNQDIKMTIVNVIRWLFGFLGIIAVSLIMYGGWMWMSSQGSEEKITQAKKIIKNATIGLLIIFSAYAIVAFIINKFFGINVLEGPKPWDKNHKNAGIGALGAGIIKSVYPEPGQREVPRNTSIIITFREKMAADSICSRVVDGTGTMAGRKVCAADAKIIPQNIRIYQTDQGDTCGADNSGCTGGGNVFDVRVFSRDNEIFVLSPVNYLGSSDRYIWYSTYLSSGLKKADGSAAFGGGLGDDYIWSYEISNKVDLTPPQVVKNGTFPLPDDQQDEVGAIDPGVQAAGSITVNGTPAVYTASTVSVVSKTGNSPVITITGNYNCKDSSPNVLVSVGTDSKISVSGPQGFTSGSETMTRSASLGCGLTISPQSSSDNFAPGNSWTLKVTAQVDPDTITVGNYQYIFVSASPSGRQILVGANNVATAANIYGALSRNNQVAVTVSGNQITVKSASIGASGNNLILSSSNTSRLGIVPLAGGSDREQKTIVKGRADKARNAVIQINFNEAILPLNVSGPAEDVKDYIRIVNSNPSARAAGQTCSRPADCVSFKCEGGTCSGSDRYLPGQFLVSNQYRTVEFISNVACGVNACGEAVYCLPELSNLRVELAAAHLTSCQPANCSDRSPYSACQNDICQDATGHRYPLSVIPPDGVADAAMNSLDGNRDNYAYGPSSFYNENSPVTVTGDSYQWSFYISDKIDLTAPRLEATDAAHNAQSVPADKGVFLNWSKVMMSSSLSSGSVVESNGKSDYTHQRLNIWNFTREPLGYWITGENREKGVPDGEPDWTQAEIRHTSFVVPANYRSQAGSGVKDIYQNCFRPCDGPACQGESSSAPSCCSGTVKNAGECGTGQ